MTRTDHKVKASLSFSVLIIDSLPCLLEAGSKHDVSRGDAWISLTEIISFLTAFLTVASQIEPVTVDRRAYLCDHMHHKAHGRHGVCS